jgi:hypothetical protein
MNKVSWIKPDGAHKRGHPSNDLYSALQELHVCVDVKKVSINGGGIRYQDSGLTHRFKSTIAMLYNELPQLPSPFTGDITFRTSRGFLEEVIFHFI